MRISNAISLAVVACFALWAAIGFGAGEVAPVAVGYTVMCSIGVFALGAALFAIGALGGGDVKLIAAASLFAGPGLLVDFLLIASLAGGLLALAMLAGLPIGQAAATTGPGTTVRAQLRAGLPYGPAIAVGGLWVALSLALS